MLQIWSPWRRSADRGDTTDETFIPDYCFAPPPPFRMPIFSGVTCTELKFTKAASKQQQVSSIPNTFFVFYPRNEKKRPNHNQTQTARTGAAWGGVSATLHFRLLFHFRTVKTLLSLSTSSCLLKSLWRRHGSFSQWGESSLLCWKFAATSCGRSLCFPPSPSPVPPGGRL